VPAMSIAEQVRSMRASQPAGPPSPFDREQQALADTTVEGVIVPGQRLPDAELIDVDGAATTLLRELAGRRAVLVFYRGAWCPFCNIALKTYQAELAPELARRGVALLAISPQKPDGSLSMREKNQLSFAVLSDPASTLAGSAGIRTAPSAEARAMQLQMGLDLTEVNAGATTTLPMPTTLILDGDATARWVDVHPDYSTRSEPAEILAALDALEG